MKLYPLLMLKKRIEYLLLLPFILWGKYKAKAAPLKEDYDLFCIYPTYDLGGAEKVNAHVVSSIRDKKIIIFFVKKSNSTTTLHLFEHPNVTIVDISSQTDKAQSFTNFIARGMVAYYMNRQQKKPVLFNGQSNFGYKLLPHLDNGIRTVELIHTSERKFARIIDPYVEDIDCRIMVAKSIVADHSRYYDAIGIPAKYKANIRIVFYKIEFYTDRNIDRDYAGRLKVFYAGRGGYQKRIHLIVEIIRQCQQLGLPLDFSFAGNYREELPEDILATCTYDGLIQSGRAMSDYQQGKDILLMTSAFEGFPLVIMESMANGVIPVVTAVDGIPEHIATGRNGFLIDRAADETHVVAKGVGILQQICKERSSLKTISDNCFSYARENFSEERFVKGYRDAFGF
jgi:glycosyltransferase involved in cell wall biosynthesis